MHTDARDNDRRITYFAATHTRGKREMFGIRAVDRGKHIYVIGKTGMGKSTMLENMAIQDIQSGEGIAFIDPHGSTAEKLLDFVPHERIQDVVYFAPFDTDYPLGFNVMEDVGYDKRHLVVSGLMGALKRIWVDSWSARMEYILQNTLLALLEYPGSTLLDVNRMLTNKTYREAVISVIQDPIVKAFWTEEFAAFTDTYTREATPAIQNKIGQFIANPLIRNIVGQSKSSFDLRKIMDEKKIFIVNLSKGRMGETNASLLGSMLTVKIYLAAMSRAEESALRMARLPRFYFYVDEFQSMMNEAFADILSESRKYKLALILANQYIEQMEENVRDAVFGNVGTLICFRVGPFDAETLKVVFEPTFMAEDLINLGVGEIYLTLMIDGVGSPPFSAETIPPIESPNVSYREDVITHSRSVYGRLRGDIEKFIADKQREFVPPPVKSKSRIKAEEYAARTGRSFSDQPARQTAPLPQNESHQEAHRDMPRAPIEMMRQSQTSPLARPDSIHAPVQTQVVAVKPAPADQRSALRSAISEAQKTAAPETVSPGRSPLDILRSKQQQRSSPPLAQNSPSRPLTRPQSTFSVYQNNSRPEPRVMPQSQSTPSSSGEEKSDERTDEVSSQLLRKVLQNRSHEEVIEEKPEDV
ncbi:MAG TPA: type IV secretion system DNA-binding domain-containing protein [Candidatus Paceibacterota bacterium]|nr:type IV secretion system DNA-binding domain-containing protein [Candidatus Paceibacterota bacterium]